MRRYSNILFFLVVASAIFSCSRNSAVTQSKGKVDGSLLSQRETKRQLDSLAKKSSELAAKREIDESTDEEIQKYIEKERATVEAHIARLEAASADLDAAKSDRKPQAQSKAVEQANNLIEETNRTLRILEQKTLVIVDFLENKTYSKSEIGALFKPGEYRLAKGQTKEGIKLFTPIVEKLYTFSNKYKDAFKSLKGEIIVTGYSDATTIQKGTALYRDLSAKIQQSRTSEEPSSADLNLKLSELRANAVRGLLEEIIKHKQDTPGWTGITINVRTMGRGEAFPKGLEAADVAVNDPRRRVVTFYWVVLPEL